MNNQKYPTVNKLRQLLDSKPTAVDGFLSYEFGLCAQRPLQKLPTGSNHELWEDWALALPELYRTGEFRSFFESQPVISTDGLADEDLLRANQILGLCAHATAHFAPANSSTEEVATGSAQTKCPFKGAIHGPAETSSAQTSCPFKGVVHQPTEPENDHDSRKHRSDDVVPKSIFLPWKAVNQRLGRPGPTFTYYDYFTLNVVPRKGRESPFDPSRSPEETYRDLRCDIQVFGDHGENIFILLNHDIEFQSIPLVRLCCDAFDCVIEEDDEALSDTLFNMGDIVKKVTESFLKSNPNCKSQFFVDPVSWSKSIGTLIPPILGGEKSLSGLQSSVTHLLDVFLGRFEYSGELGDLALEDRPWLPSLHQEFFRRLHSLSVRDYVMKSKSRALKGNFDRLVRLFCSDHAYGSFLSAHRMKICGFLELGLKSGGRTETSGQTAQTDNQGWTARVWKKVNDDCLHSMKERMQLQSNPTAEGFTHAFVQSIEELPSKSCRITFNIAGTGIRYRAGDKIEVLPTNTPELVSRMLGALQIFMKDCADSNLLVPVATKDWAAAATRHYPDITGGDSFPLPALLRIMKLRPLSRPHFDQICELVGVKDDQFLQQAFHQGGIHDIPELVELIRSSTVNYPRHRNLGILLASKLCNILPPLKARVYSIANAPSCEVPSTLSIVISRLSYHSDPVSMKNSAVGAEAEDKTKHVGVCSAFLVNQYSLYQYVPVRLVEEENFHLPPTEGKGSSIVLMALGSGAAPMFAFIQELLNRDLADCPEVIFCWGLATPGKLFGMDFLSRAIKKIGLKLCVSFSREASALAINGNDITVVPGKKERVTTTMMKGHWPHTLNRIATSNGSFFLCGHPTLGKTFRSLLESAMCTAGLMSPEESSGYYEQIIADSRIKTDLYFSGPVHDPTLPTFSCSEVANHNKMKDCWIIYKDFVYDLTDYLNLHPGGNKIIFDKAGRDATIDFTVAHGPENLRVESMMVPYRIGKLWAPDKAMYDHTEIQAYEHAVDFLHSVCEIRNVFLLDLNIFVGKGEAFSPHSLAMRFMTHEKFLSSVLPLLEQKTIEFHRKLESQIYASKLVTFSRNIPATLAALRKDMAQLVSTNNSPGYRLYVATELCHIECDFLSDFLEQTIAYMSAVEGQFKLGESVNPRPEKIAFARLQPLCCTLSSTIRRRLKSVSFASSSPVSPEPLLELVQTSLATNKRWYAVSKTIDIKAIVRLSYRQGDIIFRKGDIIDCAYILLKGKAIAEDDNIAIKSIGRGSVFGALSEDTDSNKFGNEAMPFSIKVSAGECEAAVIYAERLATPLTIPQESSPTCAHARKAQSRTPIVALPAPSKMVSTSAIDSLIAPEDVTVIDRNRYEKLVLTMETMQKGYDKQMEDMRQELRVFQDVARQQRELLEEQRKKDEARFTEEIVEQQTMRLELQRKLNSAQNCIGLEDRRGGEGSQTSVQNSNNSRDPAAIPLSQSLARKCGSEDPREMTNSIDSLIAPEEVTGIDRNRYEKLLQTMETTRKGHDKQMEDMREELQMFQDVTRHQRERLEEQRKKDEARFTEEIVQQQTKRLELERKLNLAHRIGQGDRRSGDGSQAVQNNKNTRDLAPIPLSQSLTRKYGSIGPREMTNIRMRNNPN